MLQRCPALVALLLVWSCVHGCSAPPPKVPAVAAYDCRFTEDPPEIDGDAGEKAWDSATLIDNFSMPWLGSRNRPAVKATRAKLLWDREYLYVSADMDDADLYADVKEQDGNTWENDVFEVFLKPSTANPGYYEFHVTPANTRFDVFLPRRGHANRFKSDGDFQVTSAVKLRGSLDDWHERDEGWSLEMRIPWTTFLRTGGRPEPGDDWRFALCRYDFDVANETPELSTCAPLGPSERPDFHAHERYSTIHFVGPPAENASRPYGIPKYIPVTSSKVVGSPDPPLPFTVERALPLAKISCPIVVARQPGSDLLIYATEPSSFMPSTLMRMRDDPTAFEPEVLLPEDGSCHYGITFHPKFAENGYMYVGSNGSRSPGEKQKVTRVTRYTIDRSPPYALDRDSAEVIIEWDSDGHNGGDIAFGPDGMLYVTSGDGTTDSDAELAGQDLSRLRAKVLRIDVDHPDENVPGDHRCYSVPADNPFVGTPKARPETWAYGLRNPWRIAIDQSNGQIWVGNNGQDLYEQVYLIERGGNYGWSVMEGGHPFDLDRKPGPTPILPPVAEHSHGEARSLTGGTVYTGSQFPELKGAYLYGDYSTGRIWGIRHDGKKVTWHELIADTTLQITSFGTDSRGEILITEHRPGDDGGFYRLVRTPAAKPTAPFPKRLSESGLFASLRDHRMVPGVIPYLVNAPLWSDGTQKVRFFALPTAVNAKGERVLDAAGQPAPAKIATTLARGWNFPDGTVLVKSFAIDDVEGDPSTRRWIETRFMLKEQGEWAGYSYEWNDDQTDGVLVEAGGKDRDFTIRTADLEKHPGGMRTQAWHYPSRAECMVCHSRASNYVLGLCTVQLNRDFDYAAALGPGHAVDNQLRTFEHLGILDVKWWEEAKQNSIANRPKGASWYDALMQVERLAKATDPAGRRTSSALLTRAPAAMNRLADPYDQTQDLAMRARSYLQSNCASCHVFAGGGNAMFDLDGINAFGIAGVGGGQGVDARPMHHTFGIPDARIIAPGHPERSVMVSRVSRRGAGQMPQLGTNVVDERAVQLLAEWIRSLPDPDKKPAAAETPKKPEPAAPAKDKPAGSPPGVAAVR